MNPDLRDNTWVHCGTSLLWDAQALNRVCSPEAVRSLRELLRLHKTENKNKAAGQMKLFDLEG